MQGLREFNMIKRRRFDGVPSLDKWVKEMDDRYTSGSPIWGMASTNPVNNTVIDDPPIIIPVDPRTEKVMRFNSLTDTEDVSYHNSYETTELKITSDYSYSLITSSYPTTDASKVTGIDIKSKNFMTPIFKFDLTTGYSTARGVIGIGGVYSNSSGWSRGWKFGPQHVGTWYSSLKSAWASSIKPDGPIAITVDFLGTTGVAVFTLFSSYEDYKVKILQTRELSPELKHNYYYGFGGDSYNIWLYYYDSTETEFKIQNAKWVRLIEREGLFPDSEPITITSNQWRFFHIIELSNPTEAGSGIQPTFTINSRIPLIN